MHPTIDEQLDGMARLVETAAAELGGGPTAERLRAAAGTLRRIGSSWAGMLPFLTWDNEATAGVIGEVGAEVAGGSQLVERAQAVTSEPLDPLDVVAVHERNVALRSILAQLVQRLALDAPGDAGAAARAAVASHVRERIARDPTGGRRTRT